VPLTFVETVINPEGRAVGIVSQSGAMAAVLGTTMLARAPVIRSPPAMRRPAAWRIISTGWSMIRHAGHRHDRRAVPRAAALPRGGGARRAAGKPIVLLHPGKSSAARDPPPRIPAPWRAITA
jgi:hypothetical protein